MKDWEDNLTTRHENLKILPLKQCFSFIQLYNEALLMIIHAFYVRKQIEIIFKKYLYLSNVETKLL